MEMFRESTAAGIAIQMTFVDEGNIFKLHAKKGKYCYEYHGDFSELGVPEFWKYIDSKIVEMFKEIKDPIN